jgi:multidrug efflux system membrane fusion protein
VDNRLDTASGTIRVRAVFDNADGRWSRPVRPRTPGRRRAACRRADRRKAVGTDQDKRFVLVVDKDNHANYRQVVVGAGHDGLVVIEKGLQPGERIVVNGLQRVRPGDAITPTVVPMQPRRPAADAGKA